MKASVYAVFSIPLLPYLSWEEISSSALCSRKPSAYVPPSMCVTKNIVNISNKNSIRLKKYRIQRKKLQTVQNRNMNITQKYNFIKRNTKQKLNIIFKNEKRYKYMGKILYLGNNLITECRKLVQNFF
jgi:hypothetical protein